MAIVLSGTTNDITVNGVSVATDTEVSSAVASGVATKANTADLKEIGVGQTWQDVTASRVVGTTYTNTTGKPIFIAILSSSVAVASELTIIVDDSIRLVQGSSASSVVRGVSLIVPAGSTYRITILNGSLNIWSELR